MINDYASKVADQNQKNFAKTNMNIIIVSFIDHVSER